MPIYFNGLMLGLSLIMALGPQNVFLIRQGVMRRHALLSVVTCFFCDMALITTSVYGLQDLLESYPMFRVAMCWLGAAFLGYYGLLALKRSRMKSQKDALSDHSHTTRWQIILLALGFSLLNPHAIIDSLVLIGGGSGQFPGHHQAFLLGVISSSLLWFTALTLTAYFFANALAQTHVWKRVEFGSGILMLCLSLKLVYTFYG